MTTTERLGLTKLVHNALALYDQWAADARAQDKHARRVEALEVHFPDQFYHATLVGSLLVSMKFQNRDQLVAVLRFLRKFGYKVREFEDDKHRMTRTYKLVQIGGPKEDSKYGQDINLTAYFNAEDGACKFVEVGKTHVEGRVIEAHDVPVLELRCGDEALPGLEGQR